MAPNHRSRFGDTEKPRASARAAAWALAGRSIAHGDSVTAVRWRHAWFAPLAFVLLVALGCTNGTGRREGPRELDVPEVRTYDDITAIYSFYPKDPWLRDNDGNVVGLRVSVYFQSGETEKGVFVPGKILIWLYSVGRDRSGKLVRTFEHGWEMSEQEAMNWRVRYKRRLGYQYGFPLHWPPKIELAGKQIEVQFGYERKDGRVVEGRPQRFRVPVPPGYRAMDRRPERPARARPAP